MTARGQFDLVGHSLIRYEEFSLGSLLSANNWIVAPEDSQNEWTRTLMQMIGDWRAVLRSTYIRWAMAINGVHVAAAKYKAEKEPKKFTVSSIRTDNSGAGHQEVIAEYLFKDAAESHLKIQPMLCAHGFIDLCAGLEEMLFDMYRTYWLSNPNALVRGKEFAHLRQLQRAASTTEEARVEWEKALVERINQWQRKKRYDGLDKALLGFVQNARLQTPTGYNGTTTETWAESIAGISLIRNLLMHGETVVLPELADFSQKPHGLGFRFEAGLLLRLTISNLQLLEAFCDQLLTALNLSLVERARRSLRKDENQLTPDDMLVTAPQ